jgi:hypothetical protein
MRLLCSALPELVASSRAMSRRAQHGLNQLVLSLKRCHAAANRGKEIAIGNRL